ncbi:hypothetical protein SADUNF_Sadunf12G0100000 [Salix dunnii]|uniref:Protein kinase domain-containing protein n=1 Tax=Salix dunnii TaxID=1413687 RepID=A0A835MPR5_9ROSI|nr:hypothetical protein SADUNF_Sadunf12G0100000 [Salix dunnii]
MGFAVFLVAFFIFLSRTKWVFSNTEIRALMDMKAALDPKGRHLSSWTINASPCDGSFEGVACNEKGQVANISLQGKGLHGKVSPSIAGLKYLTGLYLHYNSLYGEIPREIANLTELSDLYLNVNNLSGEIPPEIGNMANLQVLQLCYNQFTGSIPSDLGSLEKLSVLALQSNHLTGAIPASLGNLGMLMRLDLSYNHLFGSIPTKVADAPLLEFLDIRNNTLSGSVPLALKRLDDGFSYENNLGLCGAGFMSLKACNASDLNPSRPEPYGTKVNGLPREIPETANLQLPCSQSRCSNQSKAHHASAAIVTFVVTILLAAIGILTFTQYRRRKQKLASSCEISDSRPSTDQAKGVYRKNGSPLISLEYPNGWDPLADGRNLSGDAQDVFQSFRFNLEEVETATQYFSKVNLLGKINSSATYRGILRDGSTVAIKSISKSSCKSEEAEFLKGLNALTSLRHENLVRLRGFCCSRCRGECFLIYDFVPNGNLLRYLDVKDGDGHVLEWSTRVSIVRGIASGIAYLHGYKANKPSLIHQNITAEKVLIDQRYNPLLADSGLQNLLTNDIVFSALKTSAAMGYLAPEYTTTGRFTDKSDVYAFGVIVFQVLSGKRKVSNLVRLGADACRFQDYIDPNLHGRFFEYEAAKLARIAWLCTHESPMERPSMEAVVHELAVNEDIGFYELKRGDFSVKLTNYGATVISVILPDKNGKLDDIVLGYDSVDDYKNDTTYFGAIVGRVANRIGRAQFTLDGTDYKLVPNDGRNMLHGGPKGFSDVIWGVGSHDDHHVTFTYNSVDGEEGFPGDVAVSVTYMLVETNKLVVKMRAMPLNKRTPVNLALHAYWNLGGHNSGDIFSHTIQLLASKITPVDEELIPTGEIVNVKDTPYDFHKPREIGSMFTQLPDGYDINYVLDDLNPGHLKKVAVVQESVSGRKLELWTNQPGVQFYTSNMLNNVKGKDGFVYAQYAGICLETQGFPDSVNHPHFPSQIVNPGDIYENIMIYRFTAH